MLQTERDNDVFEQAKAYIENNLEKGDLFTPSEIQRRFKTGYNLASRVLQMLHDAKYIKLDKDRIKAPKVVFNCA